MAGKAEESQLHPAVQNIVVGLQHPVVNDANVEMAKFLRVYQRKYVLEKLGSIAEQVKKNEERPVLRLELRPVEGHSCGALP